MSVSSVVSKALEQGKGVLRLAPNWVPRSFCVPGRRIKLHPDDYYAMGGERGGIDERWFASTTPADNGPLTSENEGLSFVVFEDGGKVEKVRLLDAVAELKSEIIGERLWKEHQRWPMYSKFFDNKAALPHHIHHRDEHAALTGQLGKPEAYYFPPQANNHGGDFPYTFFGLSPGVTRDQVRKALLDAAEGRDNSITSLAPAYRLNVGTGWDVPPGVLHAPGSLCTYEPQKASDVFAMYENITHDQVVPKELLWKDTPKDKDGDVDWLLSVIDWDLNVDPNFAMNRFMAPKPARPVPEMEAAGYIENWICYKSKAFSAKELTVLPGKTVTIKDNACYGFITMQGHGTLGAWDIETPAIIRYGQLTCDEFFVTEKAAKEGVKITNPSKADPIVLLKHFGPDNPDLTVE
ncbi:MAG: hypothetical protein JSW66_19820 [Phycisphaerales bacterium]|nr:MAG: hypothetical protein JSW66_19820 [Phycisphaerales bacterium]